MNCNPCYNTDIRKVLAQYMRTQDEIYKDILRAVDYKIREAAKAIVAMSNVKDKLLGNASLFPDIPDKVSQSNWTWWGSLEITFTFPWDKVLADKYMLDLNVLGWNKEEREDDNRESSGEYSFLFKHPDLEGLVLKVTIDAQNAGSKCKLVKIGERTYNSPIYKVVCDDPVTI